MVNIITNLRKNWKNVYPLLKPSHIEIIPTPRIMRRLNAMFCHSDVINFGNLPYTDFKRTKTLCQGGDCCDFNFVRHKTDAGDGWERSESV